MPSDTPAPDIGPLYTELAGITERLTELDAQRGPLSQRAREIVVDLLRAEEMPTVVAAAAPWTAERCRTLAREAGVPPARRGLKKRRPDQHPTPTTEDARPETTRAN